MAIPTDQQMIDMAVEAMKRSRPEPRSDGGAPLLVGVSVRFPDGTTDSAGRGEFRFGDHAEYTLLERKHPAAAFDGADVFTTLEPCAGKNVRGEGKTPCAQRLIDARVARVWMGLEDPDPTVTGVGKAALERASIKVGLFDKDSQKTIEDANKEWIEQADRRAALVRAPDALNDDTPLTRAVVVAAAGATRADLDRTALERYRIAAQMEAPSVTHQNFIVALSQMGWMTLADDNRTFVPTKLGVILFGKRPRQFYTHCVVKASFDFGPGRAPEEMDFEGPLVLFPAELEAWLHTVLPTTQMRRKIIRENFATLTLPWIREAVINAVVHRDYDEPGTKVTLEISEDVISVTSPGRPLDQVSIESLNGFRASSLSVNPKIHFALSKMLAAEERGLGMKTLEQIVQQGFPRPTYTFVAPYLTLTIPLTTDAALAAELLVLNPDTTRNLSSDEKRGLALLIRQDGQVTNQEYATTVGVSIATVSRHYERFETAGLIVRAGPPRRRTLEVVTRARR